jgi:hypothetical protein
VENQHGDKEHEQGREIQVLRGFYREQRPIYAIAA